MNIFFVHYDPVVAAGQLCDKHIVKMCLETAQILCSVSWRYGVPAPYKATHKNHPMTLWVGEALDNWKWTIDHGLALAREYTARYRKRHKSQEKIEWCKLNGGKPLGGKFTAPPLCMPDEYKTEDFTKSYRNYYIGDKARFARWKNGNPPGWFLAGVRNGS